MKSVYTSLLFCVLASLVSGATIPEKRMNDGKYAPDKVVWYDEYHAGGGAGTTDGNGGGHGGGGGDDGHGGGGGGGHGGRGGGHDGGVKDPNPTNPDPTIPNPSNPDPGTTDPTIPDPVGPDPDSEPFNPDLVDLIDTTENEGPWPELIDFTGDEPVEDVSSSDSVPYDYCLYEGDGEEEGEGVSQIRGPGEGSEQIGQDFCLEQYGDADIIGSLPDPEPVVDNTTLPAPGNDTSPISRRSHFHKRTYVDIGATGNPNRWNRGSVISICVVRNNDYIVSYGEPSKELRASAVVNGATKRAINSWNAGLKPKYVSFEHVDSCRKAVYKVVTNNFASPNYDGIALATAPLPPRSGTKQRVINVYSTAFEDNYQNVLTAIMSHELGHALGLAHEDCSTNDEECATITEGQLGSIMKSSIAPNSTIDYRGPSRADIVGTNLFYSLPAGPDIEPLIVRWPATRGSGITYPPIPKCKWIGPICYY